ncbi:unnamed protein product [Gordionus sp. m RMFG-2023]|uniref:uncharacterized protein LOC135924591 isoform X1 n=1 Tax=Gordionus sp. m RMFG-2023 TaxID=3053472 RepID=UPI0030E3B101
MAQDFTNGWKCQAGILMFHLLVSCTLGISCASNISTSQQKFQCSKEISENYTENMEGNIFLIDLNGSEDYGMVSGNDKNNNDLPGLCLIAKVRQSSETNFTNSLSCELVALEIYPRIPFHVIEPAQESANIAC